MKFAFILILFLSSYIYTEAQTDCHSKYPYPGFQSAENIHECKTLKTENDLGGNGYCCYTQYKYRKTKDDDWITTKGCLALNQTQYDELSKDLIAKINTPTDPNFGIGKSKYSLIPLKGICGDKTNCKKIKINCSADYIKAITLLLIALLF